MNSKNALFQLFRYASFEKRTIFFASLCSALNKICDILPEIFISVAIDVVINQEHSIVAYFGIMDPYHQLYLVGALTTLFWVLESIFEYLYSIFWNRFAQKIQHELRLKTYKTIQELDLTFFEKKTNGDLLSILQDDIFQLELFLSRTPNDVIQLIVNICFMGAIFFYVSPQLALLTLVPIPFVLGITSYFQHKLAALYEKVRQTSADLTAHITYRLQGITTIKSYATELYELENLHEKSKLYQDANHRVNQLNALYIPTLRMAIMIGFIMSLVVGGMYTLQGAIAINWYATLVFLTQRFLWPFTTLTVITDMYEKSLACAKRILPILTIDQAIKSGTERLNNAEIEGTIHFRDISFTYSNGLQIFNAINFTVPAKKTVAFVGSTGSGKSTIINLLLRFYDAHDGEILIDTHDIKNLDLNNLRTTIGLVNQDIYLVEGTIADNISYGTFGATKDDIINAAKMAHVDDFIEQLPEGYDTVIQENGKNFSGGQKQRLSIARAVLKKSPILIFDEATSAIDTETEAAIQKSLAQLKSHHTIIIIAHHLSTVRDADIIFVLEDGAIVESGAHDELLAQNGHYANLWHS